MASLFCLKEFKNLPRPILELSKFPDEYRGLSQALGLFGLSEREANIYLKLASAGRMRASEIARELRMHRLDVYHALKNLQSKEIVEAILSRPMKFEALPLDQVIEVMKRKDRDDARKKSYAFIELDEASKTFSQLSSQREKDLHQRNSNNDKIQIISGRRAINEKWSKLMELSKKEILVVAADKGVVQSLLARTFGTLQEKTQAGLDVKIFSPITQSNAKHFEGVRRGARHLTTSASAGLCIIDGNQALIVTESHDGISSSEREQTAILTNSRSIVETLRTLFFVGWDTSPVFEDVVASG